MNYFDFQPMTAKRMATIKLMAICLNVSKYMSVKLVQKIEYATTTILLFVDGLYFIVQCLHTKLDMALRNFQYIKSNFTYLNSVSQGKNG